MEVSGLADGHTNERGLLPGRWRSLGHGAQPTPGRLCLTDSPLLRSSNSESFLDKGPPNLHWDRAVQIVGAGLPTRKEQGGP